LEERRWLLLASSHFLSVGLDPDAQFVGRDEVRQFLEDLDKE